MKIKLQKPVSMVLPFWLVLGLFVVFGAVGCEQRAQEKHDKTTEKSRASAVDQVMTVTVGLKFNGRADDLKLSIECSKGASVFEATQLACQANEVEFDHLGDQPELRFVTAIGGVVNEKSAGDNWTYRVNGKLGSVGSGVATLSDGDQLTWSFGKYEPKKEE